MLFFCCVPEATLGRIRRHGLRAPDDVVLLASLQAAQAADEGVVLVVDAAALEGAEPVGVAGRRVASVPPAAFCNLDPYRPPHPVAAAGGYVVRTGADGPEVLLIFRRGVWDLPKGKQDPGESVEACALREVREELGIRSLRLLEPVGMTMHGYAEEDVYRVKTTFWFLMQTPETTFVPEAREGIEAVAWTPWAEAPARIGFATLRAHMTRIEESVRRCVEDLSRSDR